MGERFTAVGVPPAAAAGGLGSVAVLRAAPVYQRLLHRYSDVLNPSKLLPPTKHSVVHHVETTGRPVCSRFRRLDAGKLAAAKAEFEQMEKEGIIQRSNSCWSSPLHMVKKADGSWQCCGDYKRLNLFMRQDR